MATNAQDVTVHQQDIGKLGETIAERKTNTLDPAITGVQAVSLAPGKFPDADNLARLVDLRKNSTTKVLTDVGNNLDKMAGQLQDVAQTYAATEQDSRDIARTCGG